MRKDQLIKIKHNIVFKQWQELKDKLTMEDLAYIFQMSTAGIYRIIKKKKQKDNDSNNKGKKQYKEDEEDVFNVPEHLNIPPEEE